MQLSEKSKPDTVELKSYFGLTNGDIIDLLSEIYQGKYDPITKNEKWVSPLLRNKIGKRLDNPFYKLIGL